MFAKITVVVTVDIVTIQPGKASITQRCTQLSGDSLCERLTVCVEMR